MTQPQKRSSYCTNPLDEEARPETEVLSSLHETHGIRTAERDRHAPERQTWSRDRHSRVRQAHRLRNRCAAETVRSWHVRTNSGHGVPSGGEGSILETDSELVIQVYI